MLVVLPVCHKDLPLALRNLDAVIAWEGRCDLPCLIAHERGFEADVSPLFDLATRYFTSVDTFIYDPWKGDEHWPQPQNWAFACTARWIESKRKWPAFFWWEADATPLRAGALMTLAAAYKAGARPFAGPVASQMGMTYLVGVAVYPANVSTHMPTGLLARSQPWDIVASTRDGILRSTHDLSELIAHDTGHGVHFDSHDDITARIPESAVFFHKCKDSSLLDVLQGKSVATAPEQPSSIPGLARPLAPIPSFTEQTSWESGYFTFPCATNTAYFNCGVCAYNDALFLFTRRWRHHLEQTSAGLEQGNRSDLAIWRLRPNLTVEPTPILPTFPKRYPHEQWEDPRVVIGEDGLAYVGFATWVHHQKWSIRQSFTRLSRDWRSVEPLWESPHGGNTRRPEINRNAEKNWIWFQHESQWVCQYAINPGEFFRVNATGDPVEVWRSKEVSLAAWNYGLPLRGGTPPTRVGDEYVAFFHTALVWQKPKRRYYMGAYTFDAEPPFTLRRMTLEPLLAGSDQDFRALGGPLVIFPNGAILRDGTWLVTFGVNDEACGWIRIPHADLEERLVHVNRKSILTRAMETFA